MSVLSTSHNLLLRTSTIARSLHCALVVVSFFHDRMLAESICRAVPHHLITAQISLRARCIGYAMIQATISENLVDVIVGAAY